MSERRGTSFGVEQARQRVLAVMRSGDWQAVETQLSAYAAAVRAEERHRAIGEALEALQRAWPEVLRAVERLR